MDWALKRNIMAAPHVKSWWEARWLGRVYSLQHAMDHKKNAQGVDNLVAHDPLNWEKMRHPLLDESEK